MKDITHYFGDTVKPNESSNANSVVQEVPHSENTSKRKRNRVKIKISRTNAEDRVCDIIESNNDMIDKTPSPFARINKNTDDGTPKRSSLSKVSLPKNRKKMLEKDSLDEPQILAEVNLNHACEPNGNLESKKRKGRGKLTTKRPSIEEMYCSKGLERNPISKDNIGFNCLSKNGHLIEIVELASEESDHSDSQREESDAFQILMNHSKSTQSVSPIEDSPQDSDLINSTKRLEQREKLQRSKEKLIALADKKGYSKRKLAELEEGEKIEKTIKNRIKTFKGDDKKVHTETMAVNQKQISSNLLSYFSKKPLEVINKDNSDVCTFEVKADVHVSDSCSMTSSCVTSTKSKVSSNKKNIKLKAHGSQLDNITLIDSEILSSPNHKPEENKRWSLRIKFQASENAKSVYAEESSDEEIFSPRCKAKFNRKSETLNSRIEDELETHAENMKQKNIKQTNKNEKSKVRRKGHLKNIESQEKEYVISDDNENTKTVSANSKKVIKVRNSSECKVDKSENSTPSQNEINTEDDSRIVLSQGSTSINNDNNSKRKCIEKLAPLFTKRRKPDPETIAARRQFLQPDITESDNKSSTRKISPSGILQFPTISHITQLNGSYPGLPNNYNIPMKKADNQYIPTINWNNYKHVTDLKESKLKSLQNVSTLSVSNVEEMLTEIEGRCSGVRKMWDNILRVSQKKSGSKPSPKARSKRGKHSDKKDIKIESKNESNNIQNVTWSYKYKPMNTADVVGNEEAAIKLKEWLDGWRSTVTNDEDASSGDEFYPSDCSRASSNENNQVAVLLGPHGSGKTASVYAVAEELGYTVLEVNASSKRTGKKLLRELEEATKSHRIRKEQDNPSLLMSVSNSSVSKKMPQNSLILLEDVDLIFEEDEGFISATGQLASNTKRPIVMTCRDVCPHLSKMAPQQNKIYFQSAGGARVSGLLELITLAEGGCRLPNNCIYELLKTGDLRKALLQLQYLLVTGPPKLLEPCINFKDSHWQNMRCCLYKPVIKSRRKRKARKDRNTMAVDDSTIDVLNNVAAKLDNVALLSDLIDIEDPALSLTDIKVQPSLSLSEDTSSYSLSRSISSDMADWIAKKVLYSGDLHDHDGLQNQSNLILRRQLNKGVHLALRQVTSFIVDQRSMSTDYLPAIRTICRSEDLRANMNNKRGNRFFHYLNGLKGPIMSLKPNILAAACKVMQDKTHKDTRTETNDNNAV